MISENERRDWIEVGVHATMAKVYGLVTAILLVNCIICLAIILFAPPVAFAAFFPGITAGFVIFMIVSSCTVKADKISRKAVRSNG